MTITMTTAGSTEISESDAGSSNHMLTAIRRYKYAPITAATMAAIASTYEFASTDDLITANFATNPAVNGTPA